MKCCHATIKLFLYVHDILLIIFGLCLTIVSFYLSTKALFDIPGVHMEQIYQGIGALGILIMIVGIFIFLSQYKKWKCCFVFNAFFVFIFAIVIIGLGAGALAMGGKVIGYINNSKCIEKDTDPSSVEDYINLMFYMWDKFQETGTGINVAGPLNAPTLSKNGYGFCSTTNCGCTITTQTQDAMFSNYKKYLTAKGYTNFDSTLASFKIGYFVDGNKKAQTDSGCQELWSTQMPDGAKDYTNIIKQAEILLDCTGSCTHYMGNYLFDDVTSKLSDKVCRVVLGEALSKYKTSGGIVTLLGGIQMMILTFCCAYFTWKKDGFKTGFDDTHN